MNAGRILVSLPHRAGSQRWRWRPTHPSTWGVPPLLDAEWKTTPPETSWNLLWGNESYRLKLANLQFDWIWCKQWIKVSFIKWKFLLFHIRNMMFHLQETFIVKDPRLRFDSWCNSNYKRWAKPINFCQICCISSSVYCLLFFYVFTCRGQSCSVLVLLQVDALITGLHFLFLSDMLYI